ncbi:MAG: response regulator transcription factor [Clostridia bacterium]|nr:response regulator transcription factor [Clostridia bacterium]
MARRILIVDDEPLIVKGLKYNMESEGYLTDTCGDGETALRMFRRNRYDMVLLDVMMPGISGTEVCQRIREISDVPIIMITAKGEDMDKILGLEYGADDYVTKPFNILEVKARVKNIFRRSAQGGISYSEDHSEGRVIRCKRLAIDTGARTATLNNVPVRLTSKEFDVLNLLASNKGKVYTRDQLLTAIWRYDYAGKGEERTVDVHIRRLREKIEADSSKPEYILTKWGVGYYFTEDE